jgi:hypothetical protein
VSEDISVDGVLLRCNRPVSDVRALVTLSLPNGEEVVSWADVVGCDADGQGSFHCRLCFDSPSLPFRATLADLFE